MGEGVSRGVRRPQASKVRAVAPPVVAPTFQVSTCQATGLPSFSYGIARSLTRTGGTITECQACDWYHVIKEEN